MKNRPLRSPQKLWNESRGTRVRAMRGFNHQSETLHDPGGSPLRSYCDIVFVATLPILTEVDPGVVEVGWWSSASVVL
jgi:hypothetical protein